MSPSQSLERARADRAAVDAAGGSDSLNPITDPLPPHGVRRFAARAVDFASRRLVGLDFDAVMALGCPIVRQLDVSESAVALTFDDGPSTHTTERVLAALAAHGAKATFFMLGENARRYPSVARAVAAEGHEVGCQDQWHLDFHWMAPWRIAEDIRICKCTLEDVTGNPVRVLRAPYGHFRWDVTRAAVRAGLSTLVGWSVNPGWNQTSPSAIVTHVTRAAKPGTIVLLHDSTGLHLEDGNGFGNAVALALDPLLSELAARGLRSVTVSSGVRSAS